jgi:hypothetical protein
MRVKTGPQCGIITTDRNVGRLCHSSATPDQHNSDDNMCRPVLLKYAPAIIRKKHALIPTSCVQKDFQLASLLKVDYKQFVIT